MGKNLNIEEVPDDKQSIFTQEKLKRFNEIQGYEDGPFLEGEEEDLIHKHFEEASNPNEGEEYRDEVHSLRSKQSQALS